MASAAVTVALFVVVWPGHDIPPQSMPATECDQAASAITLAANIRSDKYYSQDAEARAYCVPMGTAADPTVYALMAPPPKPPPPVKATLLPMPPPPPGIKD